MTCRYFFFFFLKQGLFSSRVSVDSFLSFCIHSFAPHQRCGAAQKRHDPCLTGLPSPCRMSWRCLHHLPEMLSGHSLQEWMTQWMNWWWGHRGPPDVLKDSQKQPQGLTITCHLLFVHRQAFGEGVQEWVAVGAVPHYTLRGSLVECTLVPDCLGFSNPGSLSYQVCPRVSQSTSFSLSFLTSPIRVTTIQCSSGATGQRIVLIE